MGREGLFEGNRRKSYGHGPLGPGGSDRERYSTGRRDRSTSQLTSPGRGDYTPTVRAPKSPAPTSGDHPLSKRVGPVHDYGTHPGLEKARNGNVHAPGGSTLTHDLHMRATKNTGKQSDAYSTPKPKTVK